MDGRLRDKNVLFEFFTQFELNNYSRFLPIITPYEYLSRFKIQSHLEITVISSNLDIEARFPKKKKERNKIPCNSRGRVHILVTMADRCLD